MAITGSPCKRLSRLHVPGQDVYEIGSEQELHRANLHAFTWRMQNAGCGPNDSIDFDGNPLNLKGSYLYLSLYLLFYFVFFYQVLKFVSVRHTHTRAHMHTHQVSPDKLFLFPYVRQKYILPFMKIYQIPVFFKCSCRDEEKESIFTKLILISILKKNHPSVHQVIRRRSLQRLHG